MSHSKDDKDRKSLDRRTFIKVGGLGAAAMASGAAGRGPLEAEDIPEQRAAGQAAQGAQGRGGQAPARRGSAFRRNNDPVPEAAPKMHFAVFTDTHVGQHNRSPQWDFAQHLDKLAGDIMDHTLPCEFVVHLGDGAPRQRAAPLHRRDHRPHRRAFQHGRTQADNEEFDAPRPQRGEQGALSGRECEVVHGSIPA